MKGKTTLYRESCLDNEVIQKIWYKKIGMCLKSWLKVLIGQLFVL